MSPIPAGTRLRTFAGQGFREMAIIHLMYDPGLRVGDVAALDLADLDLPTSKLWVLGKGRRGKDMLSVPAPTQRC